MLSKTMEEQKKKICVINSLYPPFHRGGAEVVTKTVVDSLLHHGHAVTVITLGRKAEAYCSERLTMYRLKPRNIFSFLDIHKRPIWLRLLWHPLDVFNVISAYKVKKILQLEKPDVVMTHNLKGLGYLIPYVIRRLKIKHVHTVHDVQLSRPSGLILFGEEKPFLVIDKVYEKICRKLFSSPDVIISPSKWLLDFYIQKGFFYKSRRLVIPNPVAIKKPETQDIVHSQPDGMQLLFVGQIERVKGILFLISALQSLQTHQQWKLTIVGDGAALPEVEQLIKDDARFELRGRVAREQMPHIYRKADITIVPSLCYENSPSVIYESLVANIPVIASDIGGVGELVKDDYNGFTFAPGNSDNLQKVVKHFLEHPALIKKLKRNCFLSVRNATVSNYIKQIEREL